jgi:hypothetical protein
MFSCEDSYYNIMKSVMKLYSSCLYKKSTYFPQYSFLGFLFNDDVSIWSEHIILKIIIYVYTYIYTYCFSLWYLYYF